jgi:hypothetical protein
MYGEYFKIFNNFQPTYYMSDKTKATIMRTILALCIGLSIGIMYFVYIVEKDYLVITNSTGPDRQ